VERGDTERAATLFSNGYISKQSIDSLKHDISNSSLEIKEHGGIKSFKVLKEDIVGDVAEVSVQITRGNGNIVTVQYKLIKEQGTWKVDGVSMDSSEINRPLHPESAVEDVVKWARDANVMKLAIWLKNQQVPPICKVAPIDQNSLPDEIKYHDVDDPQIRQRLITALQPVLKVIGCPSTPGVVLYKGTNVYAGDLDGGWIAITPGDLYFAGTPPDEHIFHELAELRIFFAREVLRQILPIDKPTPALTNSI
jgi:hypothetical protein